MNNSSVYIAIIGDFVHSRSLKHRGDVQDNLNRLLKNINKSGYNDTIRSKFVITLGDEFQGLVTRDFPLEKFLEEYEYHFGNKIQTRFGIGLGRLSTKLKDEAIGMDGPCFHNARNALEQAKSDNEYLLFKGFEMNTALNSLFKIVNNYKINWTKRQAEVILIYIKAGDQVSVAEELNLAKQTVNKIIKASNFEFYKDGWAGINQLLAYGEA